MPELSDKIMSYSNTALLLVCSILLCACGNKGDLTLQPSEADILSREALDRLSSGTEDAESPASEITDSLEDTENRPTKKPRPEQ